MKVIKDKKVAMIENRDVVECGNGGIIYVPKKYINKKCTILIHNID